MQIGPQQTNMEALTSLVRANCPDLIHMARENKTSLQALQDAIFDLEMQEYTKKQIMDAAMEVFRDIVEWDLRRPLHSVVEVANRVMDKALLASRLDARALKEGTDKAKKLLRLVAQLM